MNNMNFQYDPIYYDKSYISPSITKPVRNNKQILGSNDKKVEFFKFRKDYFPENSNTNNDESLSSSQTTKMKSRDGSKSLGLRPKSGSKSLSISEKSTTKVLYHDLSKKNNEIEKKNMASMKRGNLERIKESEMLELYRIIHFYQGKIKQLEEQIKRYQQVLQKIGRECDEKSKHKTQVEQLVKLYEGLRKDNEELGGKLEQKEHTIGVLEQKNYKQQMKINFVNSKNEYLKRQRNMGISEQQKIGCLRQKIKSSISSAISLKQKKDKYGNMQSKINKLENGLAFLKKENENLEIKLLGKDEQSEQFARQIKQLIKMQATFNNRTSYQNTVQINQPENKNIMKQSNSLNQLLTFSSQNFMNSNNVKPIIKQQYQKQQKSVQQTNETILIKKALKLMDMSIFKKLKYQLLTEQITFDEFIEFLLNEETEAEILQQPPYNLKSNEAEQLVDWVKYVKQQCQVYGYDCHIILKQIIPKQNGLTLRKENDLKIQIYNQKTNREQEFKDLLQKNKVICHDQLCKYLIGWGLSQDHIDTLSKFHYQESGGKIEEINLQIIERLIDNWGEK